MDAFSTRSADFVFTLSFEEHDTLSKRPFCAYLLLLSSLAT